MHRHVTHWRCVEQCAARGPRSRRSIVALGPRKLPAVVAALLLAPRSHAADPPVAETLRRAGAYVTAYVERLALVCASERLEQHQYTRPSGAPRAQPTHKGRLLVSDVLWVPTGDSVLLAFYRDVWSMDGRALRERDQRLLRLFQAPDRAGRDRVGEIVTQ